MALDKLRSRVSKLEEEVKNLESLTKIVEIDKSHRAAEIQVAIFTERILLPYLEGLCDELNLTLQQGLKLLISKKKPLHQLAIENKEALQTFLQQPELRVFSTAAAPLAKASDEWTSKQTDTLIKIAEKTQPELADIVKNTEGGKEWLSKSLIGLRKIIFGKRR